MSLVSTYVRADDGEMYRNPVLEGDGWFICFDDDDPVELVVADESGIKEPMSFLKSIGIPPQKVKKTDRSGGQRMFQGEFKPAEAWFFDITRRIPASAITRHGGTVERDHIHQGVVYDFPPTPPQAVDETKV